MKSAQQIVFGEGWQAIGIFTFAFFLYAVLQSQAIQSLFTAKSKWLQKKGLWTVALITIFSSFLASGLSWYDEFIHFYPLVVPLLLAMGFDIFGALLCLYGGASAGQMAKFSSEAMQFGFNQSANKHPTLEGKGISFSGNDGIGFRMIAWLALTAIVVMFNLWYCNKVFQKRKIKTKQLTTQSITEKVTPKFTTARKWILFLAGFFLAISIAGQMAKGRAKKWEENYKGKIPPEVTSSYEAGENYSGKEHIELGAADKKGATILAEVKEDQKENLWGTFGKWEELQIYSWFIIGGIIICLLSKQNIVNTLIVSLKKSIPLVLSYILMFTPMVIIRDSGMSKNISELLPTRTTPSARYWLLFGALLIPLIISLVFPILRHALNYIAVPLFYAVSKNTLMYGIIIVLIGSTIGMTFSPVNGILQTSLQQNKITYKEFLKKTWVLGLLLLAVVLPLIWFCAWRLAI
ncbi:hypothetical protein [endosymbiont GvMRE of Glomus versiforme]|uniref:hypothetical protein n=1 Tax=endosymbiont GvMRE of Glomus versiforme TaxID=2039283 RepID=UPI0011C36761|nr:hypothetical protein [endosymbiont GvMRE of Glomus versiforme]